MTVSYQAKILREEILNRLPLPTLFQRYNVQPGRTKNTYHCPFHDDKNPSLSTKNGFWKCYAGCGEGNAIDFVKATENLNNSEAFKKAAEIAGLELLSAKRLIKGKEGKHKVKTACELDQRHFKYLLDVRGITPETAMLIGLKARRDLILFPQYRNGQMVGYKFRSMNDKHKMGFEGADRTAKLWPNDRLARLYRVGEEKRT